MVAEDLPDQDNIDDDFHEKYIGAEVIMDVPVEVPRRTTLTRCVKDLDGAKVGIYHRNPLMDNR